MKFMEKYYRAIHEYEHKTGCPPNVLILNNMQDHKDLIAMAMDGGDQCLGCKVYVANTSDNFGFSLHNESDLARFNPHVMDVKIRVLNYERRKLTLSNSYASYQDVILDTSSLPVALEINREALIAFHLDQRLSVIRKGGKLYG